VRVHGPGAWDAVDRLLPCTLALRDGQGRHTLLLDDLGVPQADVWVFADDDVFWLILDGASAADVAQRLVAFGAEAEDAQLARLEVAGPFAWELAAKLVGPTVIGLPYLELKSGALPCLRAGRSGEYGYELLLGADAGATRDRLLELGAPLDAREVPRSSLDRAALENAFWVPHTPGLADLDLLALQLQWRVAWDKRWPGSERLRAQKQAGIPQRISGFRARTAAIGAPIRLGAQRVGEVRVVLPDGGDGVMGYALIDTSLAHPGVPGLATDDGPVQLVSTPFVRNLSLFVKPQRHRYATRAEIALP
jgi:glycine cleavage system aminomethyltransferase T